MAGGLSFLTVVCLARLARGELELDRSAIVVGLTLAFVAVFLLASFLAERCDRMVRRALVGVANPDPSGNGGAPPSGRGIFAGIVRGLGGEEAEAVVARRRWFERIDLQSPWVLTREQVDARPFGLELPGGEVLDVELSRPPELDDAPDEVANQGATSQTRVARLRAGESVWVTGRIVRPRRGHGGPFREPARGARIAPIGRRRAVVVSRELPAARWRALGRAHRVGAFSAIGGALLVHATGFAPFDRALFHREAADVVARTATAGAIALGAAVVLATLGVWMVIVRAAGRRG